LLTARGISSAALSETEAAALQAYKSSQPAGKERCLGLLKQAAYSMNVEVRGSGPSSHAGQRAGPGLGRTRRGRPPARRRAAGAQPPLQLRRPGR
jgi:hypothetical protein